MPGVESIASASDCAAQTGVPIEWDEVNSAFHYASPADAEAAGLRAGAADFEIHATLLFPLVFDGTVVDHIRLNLKAPASKPGSEVAALPPLETLGLDVVALGHPSSDHTHTDMEWISFDCAPLACNGLGADYPVNRWCLLNEWTDAVRAARRFAVEEPEPGPYVIVEVRRLVRELPGIEKEDRVV